jgi:hypothetical protein
MMTFNKELNILFEKFNTSLKSNMGRRNALLSGLQEKYFADALMEVYPNTTSDGRTGQPDILIPELSLCLECKLTSPLASTGAIIFQSDSMTFNNKPNGVDFLYVIANKAFESFAVLHFSGLTRDDFKKESPGSRGRIHMKKSNAMLKCKPLIGGVINKRLLIIEKYKNDLVATRQSAIERLGSLQALIEKANYGTKKKQRLEGVCTREAIRLTKKVAHLEEKIEMHLSKPPLYSITYENLGEICQTKNLICEV